MDWKQFDKAYVTIKKVNQFVGLDKSCQQNMIWEQPSFSACLVKKLSLAGQVLKISFSFF